MLPKLQDFMDKAFTCKQLTCPPHSAWTRCPCHSAHGYDLIQSQETCLMNTAKSNKCITAMCNSMFPLTLNL